MKKILATLILFVLISSTNIATGQNAKSEKQKKQEAKIKEAIVYHSGMSADYPISYGRRGEAEKLGPKHNLVEDLGMDSLDCAEFVFDIEEIFDIELEDALFEKTESYTLGAIFKLVTKKVAEKEKAAEKDAK